MEFKAYPRSIVDRPKGKLRPVDKELSRYDEYMNHVRGLAPKTRSMALRIVGWLLSSQFGDGLVKIAEIKPDHVRSFFAEQAKLYSKPANAGTVVAALRSYFRYRASRGDAVHDLVGVLAYPANWQLSSLPKSLTAEEVEQLVGALGQPGRSMRRADAIVRCALDLGRRSGEVAQIGLDDIDQHAGTHYAASHQGPARRSTASAGSDRQSHRRLLGFSGRSEMYPLRSFVRRVQAVSHLAYIR